MFFKLIHQLSGQGLWLSFGVGGCLDLLMVVQNHLSEGL